MRGVSLDKMKVLFTVLLLMETFMFGYVQSATAYIWPLNHIFFGHEAVHNRRSLDSPNDKSFSTHANANTRLTVQSAIFFNGNEHIDVPISDDVPITSMTFNVFIKPTSLRARSVMVHYKANTPRANAITEFLLEGINDDLKYVYKYDDGSKIEEYCSKDVKLDILLLYTLMQNNTEEKLKMYFDLDHNHQFTTSGKPTALSTPGILRFGEHQELSGLGYIGEMSCATLLNNDIPLGIHGLTEIEQICNGVTAPFSEPVLVWPFDNKSLGYEVIYQTQPVRGSDPLRFESGPNVLPNSAIYFDGWPLSSIVMNISSLILQNDFSFLFFLREQQYSYGTVLEIRNNETAFTGIQELVLKITGNGFELSIYDGSGQCGHIAQPSSKLQRWSTIAIQRHENSLIFMYENQTTTKTDTCNPYSGTTHDFKLIIGGSKLFTEGFKGQMRCLAVFDDIYSLSELQDTLISTCSSSLVSNFVRPESTKISKILSSYQRLLARNKKPPSDQGMYTFESSLVNCGRQCLVQPTCRSFTHSKIDNKCALYSYFMLAQLNASEGTNYYAIVNLS